MFDKYFDNWNNINYDIYVPYTLKEHSPNTFTADDEWEILQRPKTILYGRNFEDRIKHRAVTVDVAKNVCDNIENAVVASKFLAVEIGSTYTGLSLEMLSRDKFHTVLSYATDFRTLDMLRRNINFFRYGSKSISAAQWDGNIINFPGCVMVISSIIMIKGVPHVDAGLRITLSDFLEMHKSIVHVISIKGSIKAISGWDITSDGEYTTMRNVSGMVDGIDGGLQSSILKSQVTAMVPIEDYTFSLFEANDNKINIEIPSSNFSKLFMDRRSKSLWREITTSLPRVDKDIKVASAEWLKNYKSYLKVFLTKLTKGDTELLNLVPGMLSDKAMKAYWIRSMVHESANAENNYERLEIFGDEFLNTAFFAYTSERFPKMTPEEFTSLKHEYLSVDKQPTFSRELHLEDWIISNLTVGRKILEDIFESFCGALYFAAEESQRCMGMTFVKLLVVAIFDDIDLYGNEDAHVGNKKMVIDTINSSLFGKDNPMTNNFQFSQNGSFNFRMNILSHAVDFFSKRGIESSSLRDMKITGKGKSSHEAELDAHKKLYFILKGIGVTLGWAKQLSAAKKITNDSVLSELQQRVLIKAKKIGYKDVVIKKYDADVSHRGASLVGINADGKRVNLTFIELVSKSDIGGSQKDNIMIGELYQKFLKK